MKFSEMAQSAGFEIKKEDEEAKKKADEEFIQVDRWIMAMIILESWIPYWEYHELPIPVKLRLDQRINEMAEARAKQDAEMKTRMEEMKKQRRK